MLTKNMNILVAVSQETNSCNPSPCGPNADCNNGICTCIRDYRGDPYTGCRPECVLNNDCPTNQACIRSKCADPCPGTCGQNAQCNIYNHIPICSCPAGNTGNAFVLCSRTRTFIRYSSQRHFSLFLVQIFTSRWLNF